MLRYLLLSCVFAMVATGCGMQHAGAYLPEPELMEGREESDRPGYDLDGVRQKLQERPQTLTLNNNGTYERTYGQKVNTGTWDIEGDTIYLDILVRDGKDHSDSAAQDWEFKIREPGVLTWDGPYGYYGINLVWRRQ